ncbi:MAG: hypothetical protein AB7V37_12605 [Eubacteriaceae bacterium]
MSQETKTTSKQQPAGFGPGRGRGPGGGGPQGMMPGEKPKDF